MMDIHATTYDSTYVKLLRMEGMKNLLPQLCATGGKDNLIYS
jgi:hypothetical protein